MCYGTSVQYEYPYVPRKILPWYTPELPKETGHGWRMHSQARAQITLQNAPCTNSVSYLLLSLLFLIPFLFPFLFPILSVPLAIAATVYFVHVDRLLVSRPLAGNIKRFQTSFTKVRLLESYLREKMIVSFGMSYM